MAEKGQVVETDGDMVVVKMRRTEACAHCRACLTGLSEQEMIINAINKCDAKTGDWVDIELYDNGFFTAVLVLYGIPMLALMAGILLGYFLAPLIGAGNIKEPLSFIVGVIFTLFSYLWIKNNQSRWENKKYKPVAARISE